MRRAILAILVTSAVAACGGDPPICRPDEVRACACGNGWRGTQQCAPTQEGWEGCACSGTSPCGARLCGDDPRTGARCGDCIAGYACSASGACVPE